MINRIEYLNQLRSFKDTNLIKVVTGLRRCGKSTLFHLYQEELMNLGVPESQIIYINFEDLDYEDLTDYKKLYQYIKTKLVNKEMYYIFFDEIQNVSQYEKVVDSLYIKDQVDLYITGSNAYLLSGELATLLSGRYVELKMQPLSFLEYTSAFPNEPNYVKLYHDYQVNSSFPGAIELKTYHKIKEYLVGIYHTILIKDVMTRYQIVDMSVLGSIVKFMFDNIGNLCNPKKIADTMTSDGRKISSHTVERYLHALCGSYVLYKVPRFDIKGKQYLKSGEKYYIADIGLRYALLGFHHPDSGHILENIVYLELIRRNKQVYIGKVGQKEVDFITEDQYGYAYYQVTLTMRDENTKQRELAPLYLIDDHYPKYVLTLDDDPSQCYDGIWQYNVIEWLLEK